MIKNRWKNQKDLNKENIICAGITNDSFKRVNVETEKNT